MGVWLGADLRLIASCFASAQPSPGLLSRRREGLGEERPFQVVAAPGRLLRIRSAALRARLHELGSLRMSRVGIAVRTFRCYGIGGVWVVGFCWVRLESFTSRMEKSNTFRSFVKM